MAMFASPEMHAANPPETWAVARVGRRWSLCAADAEIGSFETRRDAEGAKSSGFYAALYAKEARWYAGEPVRGWKPYSRCRP